MNAAIVVLLGLSLSTAAFSQIAQTEDDKPDCPPAMENASRFPHPHTPGDDYGQLSNEGLH